MCILFVYAGEKPAPDSYKLILAVNRDETYARPTSSACFWDTTPNILGGRDMEPGREGGTWLAMSKTGRIGALLNVLQKSSDTGNRKGRGFLVNDLLTSVNLDSMEYLNDIYEKSSEYNPFSMVTIDIPSQGSPRICYYSSSTDKKPRQLPIGTAHGVGNSFIENPFKKVETGQAAFAKIVEELNTVSRRGELTGKILEVMKNENQFHPDPQIIMQAPERPSGFAQGISSRFIKLPGYGTRTHTVILVDWQNRVSYQEMTLEEPITGNNPKWITSTFEFEISDK